MIKRLERFTFFQSEIANIHAAALILGGAGLLSRALGVVRDRMLAARFESEAAWRVRMDEGPENDLLACALAFIQRERNRS